MLRRRPSSPRSRRPTACAAIASGLLGAGALFGAPSPAKAQTISEVCDNNPLHCQLANLSFFKENDNPINFGVDTGWVPAGSPLQVHLAAGIYANTYVSLEGYLLATYPGSSDDDGPSPLSTGVELGVFGLDDGGLLGMHYGVEVVAEGKIAVTVLGQSFGWTGPLPFVPQFDFQVQDELVFDPFAYHPGVGIQDETNPQQLAKVGLKEIVGASIPGLDGGFELDASIDVLATYKTREIALFVNGEPVEGGPLSASYHRRLAQVGGDEVTVTVEVRGEVEHTGTLHLIPAFYASLLGNSWSIPIVDIPLTFGSIDADWVFPVAEVAVRLPDVDLALDAIDFGEVPVGQTAGAVLPLDNLGKAPLGIVASGHEASAFSLDSAVWEIAAKDGADAALYFSPTAAGSFQTTVTLTTNDPDEPELTLVLHGVGVDDGTSEPLPDGEPTSGPPSAADGCGCRLAADASSRSGEVAFAAALLGAAFVRRRRQRLRR